MFTDLDFEGEFNSSDVVESESMKRMLVSSKHGMVFCINYHTQKLENYYQLHDGAIHSIAVNVGFCVTGSEDHLLRVWFLDFSEFFIEAKHDGEVGYRTLLRSHSDEIIAADYNTLRNNVITVSKDKMIRLWEVDGSF